MAKGSEPAALLHVKKLHVPAFSGWQPLGISAASSHECVLRFVAHTAARAKTTIHKLVFPAQPTLVVVS